MKCLRFVSTTTDCREKKLLVAGSNLRKFHVMVCPVIKYSTMLEVFWQPCPGVSKGNEFPHGVSDPIHIIILKYDYMNDYMYDYMKGGTDSVWEFTSRFLRPPFCNPRRL